MIPINKKWLEPEFSNPFNYTGGKHRYLKDLFDVLPDCKMLSVLDPFVGGADLSSKLPIAWNVVAGDISHELISLHIAIDNREVSNIKLQDEITARGLSMTNKGAYLKLREDYNVAPCSLYLYLLICHSNTNRMRFNKSGGFNMPFGKGRSWFNPNMVNKLKNYQKLLINRNINFYQSDFDEWNFYDFDLTLIDSPYLNTDAVYNGTGKAKNWGEDDQARMLIKADETSDRGKKFIFFGQTFSKGVHNQDLYLWSIKYNVRVLKDTSHQCSHNRNNGATEEVMVWNY